VTRPLLGKPPLTLRLLPALHRHGCTQTLFLRFGVKDHSLAELRPADCINDQCSLITRQVSKKLGNRRPKNSRLNRCES
jgi:hypothetical protein